LAFFSHPFFIFLVYNGGRAIRFDGETINGGNEENYMVQLDYQLFQVINHWAATVSFLNPLMRFLAQDAEYIFYLGVIVYWLVRTEKSRTMIVQALLSACIALGVGGVLGHFFYRDRPFVAHAVLQLIKHPANASFPSDHATAAFAIATTIWLFRNKDGRVWLVLAACIALSRVWTGVHYPSDVAAGAILGFVAAVGVHRLFDGWGLANRSMQSAIGLYERIEHKVWPRKPDISKRNL
jgi:undecaprenyl-diphosphatase